MAEKQEREQSAAGKAVSAIGRGIAHVLKDAGNFLAERWIPQGAAELGRALMGEHAGYEPYGPMKSQVTAHGDPDKEPAKEEKPEHGLEAKPKLYGAKRDFPPEPERGRGKGD